MIQHRPLVTLAVAFVAGVGVWAAGIHSLACAAALGALGLASDLQTRRRWEWGSVGLVLAGLSGRDAADGDV